MMEIERKFLVNKIPGKLGTGSGKPVLQGYLSTGDDTEVRIRRIGKKYFLTSKNGNGLKREEKEVSINQRQFELLWPVSAGKRVEKERYIIRIGNGLKAELDLYRESLSGLRLVEVEFPDVDKAKQFKPPSWFGPEVTDDIQFSNRRLATYSQNNIPGDLQNVLGEIRHSVGSIPVMQFNGAIHFVVISTRNNLRWIFPKGNPKAGIADDKVAAREALEEAGVAGEFYGNPIPVHYWKGYAHYMIDYYPMLVSTLHTSWDEKDERQRRVCVYGEAEGLLDDAGLIEAMQASLEALPDSLNAI